MLEREARALLARLGQVQPFVLAETMVPAAALSPGATAAIDRYLIAGRRRLRGQVQGYIRWLRGPGRTASPALMQRRFTIVKLGFNKVLSQLDLFSEAISQRSEAPLGVLLAGLDVAASEAVTYAGSTLDVPPVICLVHRGLGGAIRRARTRLPGGGANPASIIRIPRERMIGYGVASSLVHEVGHEAASLLGLMPSLRAELQRRARGAPAPQRRAWRLWERWISEIVADFWAIGKVGIASTMGLIGIVSLPKRFVFRMPSEDPHPFGWIRVVLSCAIGNALYPHPQWGEVADVWRSLYPPRGLHPRMRSILVDLQTTMPAFVELLVRHRLSALAGRSLAEVMPLAERTPSRLLALWDRWAGDVEAMRSAPPTLAFAVLGRARASGRITPERETVLLTELITAWALRSALDTAELSAAASPLRLMPGGQPAIWRTRSTPLLRPGTPAFRPQAPKTRR
jgi:hypothetical protein